MQGQSRAYTLWHRAIIHAFVSACTPFGSKMKHALSYSLSLSRAARRAVVVTIPPTWNCSNRASPSNRAFCGQQSHDGETGLWADPLRFFR